MATLNETEIKLTFMQIVKQNKTKRKRKKKPKKGENVHRTPEHHQGSGPLTSKQQKHIS